MLKKTLCILLALLLSTLTLAEGYTVVDAPVFREAVDQAVVERQPALVDRHTDGGGRKALGMRIDAPRPSGNEVMLNHRFPVLPE